MSLGYDVVPVHHCYGHMLFKYWLECYSIHVCSVQLGFFKIGSFDHDVKLLLPVFYEAGVCVLAGVHPWQRFGIVGCGVCFVSMASRSLVFTGGVLGILLGFFVPCDAMHMLFRRGEYFRR